MSFKISQRSTVSMSTLLLNNTEWFKLWSFPSSFVLSYFFTPKLVLFLLFCTVIVCFDSQYVNLFICSPFYLLSQIFFEGDNLLSSWSVFLEAKLVGVCSCYIVPYNLQIYFIVNCKWGSRMHNSKSIGSVITWGMMVHPVSIVNVGMAV